MTRLLVFLVVALTASCTNQATLRVVNDVRPVPGGVEVRRCTLRVSWAPIGAPYINLIECKDDTRAMKIPKAEP